MSRRSPGRRVAEHDGRRPPRPGHGRPLRTNAMAASLTDARRHPGVGLNASRAQPSGEWRGDDVNLAGVLSVGRVKRRVAHLALAVDERVSGREVATGRLAEIYGVGKPAARIGDDADAAALLRRRTIAWHDDDEGEARGDFRENRCDAGRVIAAMVREQEDRPLAASGRPGSRRSSTTGASPRSNNKPVRCCPGLGSSSGPGPPTSTAAVTSHHSKTTRAPTGCRAPWCATRVRPPPAVDGQRRLRPIGQPPYRS